MEEKDPNKLFKFTNYYKYAFTFVADDGERLYVGGNADDIYRSDVKSVMTRQQIENELGPSN